MSPDSDSQSIRIRFVPSKKQYIALQYLTDYKTDFVGYGGAAFSGKTYLICYWITINCIAYPGTAWGLGRRELTVLRKTTLITLFKVFDECNIRADIDFKYNQQSNIIRFSNGSDIFLIDTETKPSDPLFTRFGGLELTGCAVDESAENTSMAIEILSTRIGRRLNDKYGIRAKFLETFNPAKNHVYTRYYKPYSSGNESENVKFVRALPSDNPSPEVDLYVKRILESGSNVTKERLIYGNFEYDDDPSVLMDYERIVDIFTNNFPALSGRKYITADIARKGKDSTVICIWDGFRVVKIIQLSKSLTTETAQRIALIRMEHQVPLQNVICDEDGVGGGVVDILDCQGFVNNARAIGKKNYANLKTQCYFALSERVNNSGLYVACEDPAIREMIVQELEQVKQDKIDQDGKIYIVGKDQVKERIGRSSDYSDALMMREYFELAQDGLIY